MCKEEYKNKSLVGGELRESPRYAVVFWDSVKKCHYFVGPKYPSECLKQNPEFLSIEEAKHYFLLVFFRRDEFEQQVFDPQHAPILKSLKTKIEETLPEIAPIENLRTDELSNIYDIVCEELECSKNSGIGWLSSETSLAIVEEDDLDSFISNLKDLKPGGTKYSTTELAVTDEPVSAEENVERFYPVIQVCKVKNKKSDKYNVKAYLVGSEQTDEKKALLQALKLYKQFENEESWLAVDRFIALDGEPLTIESRDNTVSIGWYTKSVMDKLIASNQGKASFYHYDTNLEVPELVSMQSKRTDIVMKFVKPKVSVVWSPSTPDGDKDLDSIMAAMAKVSTTNNGENAARLWSCVLSGNVRVSKDSTPSNNKFGGHPSAFSTGSLALYIQDTDLNTIKQFQRHKNEYQEKSGRYSQFIKEDENGKRYINVSAFSNPKKKGKTGRDATGIPVQLSLEEELDRLDLIAKCVSKYDELLKQGTANEDARSILPSCITSDFYAVATIRNLFYMLVQRLFHATQDAFRHIAVQIKDILIQYVPVLSADVDNYRFWSLMKGDDIISHNRYKEGVCKSLGIDPKDFIPYIILVNKLSLRTATTEELEHIERVRALYPQYFNE